MKNARKMLSVNELNPDTRYEVGMYGGKFMPMHKGHLHCLEVASRLCERVYLLLFVGGYMEKWIRELDDRDILSEESRWRVVRDVAGRFDNVTPKCIDVSECVTPDGAEDWYAETPLVLDACGHIDAVFSSEPELYDPYFKSEYPDADHIIVDANREVVPISATDIRHMTDEEAARWML